MVLSSGVDADRFPRAVEIACESGASGFLAGRAVWASVVGSTELERDLRLEAAGADELGEVMAKDGYMRAPKVVWAGVGKRVLTLEWAKGHPRSEAGP